MKQEYTINAYSGKAINVAANQMVTIIDIDGKQVVDFFAETLENQNEFLSTGVTIDCNDSLRLNVGNLIYSNLYKPMFELISDDVGGHDLLHPCCRKEMYDFFYYNGTGHPNCFDNINKSLNSSRSIIHPINFFMNTKINTNGSISVENPISRPGDKVILKAQMNVRLGIAACSVSESKCNGGKCSSIKVVISD